MSVTTRETTSTWLRRVRYLILLFLVLLIAGLFLASYSTGFVLLLGVVLAWPVRGVFRLVVASARRWGWGLVALLALALFPLLLCLWGWPFFFLPVPPRAVTTYKASIEQVDPAANRFRVKEEGIFNCTESSSTCFNPNKAVGQIDEDIVFSLPEREVVGTGRGLLVKEVHIVPLEVNTSGHISLALPDGTLLKGPLCTNTCPASSIELLDFPKDSFYAARDANDIDVYPYINTETVTWSVRDLERGIVFAYVPPPYHHLRPILKPFLGVSSLSQWVIGLVGIIGTIIVTPILKPVLIDIAKDKLKTWFQKTPKEKPSKKVKLVISGKGDEKEIEINE